MSTARRTRSEIDLSKIDWARFEAVDDETIEAQVTADADTSPIFTTSELARAQRVTPTPHGKM